ncbi:MAG TPA: HEPN domain-containing protein [Candidatus Hydrogenedentes bacterium]|nr:HEPN domain-containing protein [Candidatus Hydrogenedentota bacterium]HPG67701.1 HEPN domain-containing protein [Candidatus Hydrogenedentota bacterium]
MAACDEARQLLAAARKDKRALEGMADENAFADEIFGFRAQQAVEKALKAWMAVLDLEYPRTHDLSLLLSMLRDHGQETDSLLDLIEFNPYAVEYRYGPFDDVGLSLDRCSAISRIGGLLWTVEELVELKSRE